jgi:hypothetical protein
VQFYKGASLAERPIGLTGRVPEVTVAIDRRILDDFVQRPAPALLKTDLNLDQHFFDKGRLISHQPPIPVG